MCRRVQITGCVGAVVCVHIKCECHARVCARACVRAYDRTLLWFVRVCEGVRVCGCYLLWSVHALALVDVWCTGVPECVGVSVLKSCVGTGVFVCECVRAGVREDVCDVWL